MIEVEHSAGLHRLILNRPDKANSLTREMLLMLEAGVLAASVAEAKVLVLTGHGKVFSAGADLEQARAGLATDPVWERVSAAIAAFPGLSIAALNGTLAGGAMGMALSCDLRIAVAGAKVFYPVMRLGFLPQPSDPGRLVALVGPARAKMILMAGVKVAAEEARDWGLIDRVVAPEALADEVAALTADVLAADLTHVSAIKKLI